MHAWQASTLGGWRCVHRMGTRVASSCRLGCSASTELGLHADSCVGCAVTSTALPGRWRRWVSEAAASALAHSRPLLLTLRLYDCRNEQEIDRAMAEMEELEEQLADSIR